MIFTLNAAKSKKTAENWDLQYRIDKAIDAGSKVKAPCSIIYHSFGYYHKGKHSLGAARILRAYPNNRLVMRPSEKSEAKAAGAKSPQTQPKLR